MISSAREADVKKPMNNNRFKKVLASSSSYQGVHQETAISHVARQNRIIENNFKRKFEQQFECSWWLRHATTTSKKMLRISPVFIT
jgi:hypothetical protein